VSTRAKIASAVASTGVLLLGWQGGAYALARLGDDESASVQVQESVSPVTSSSNPSSSPSSTASASSGTQSASAGSDASSTGLTDGTWTGSPASERYGTWTVTLTVQGGRITDVAAVANSSESRSDQINSRAEPILTSEVLSAQSADVDAVSGATYSSRAYLSSLQSALDQASA